MQARLRNGKRNPGCLVKNKIIIINGVEESKRTRTTIEESLGNNSALNGDCWVLGHFLVGLGIRLGCHPLEDILESKNRDKNNLLLDPFLCTIHSSSDFHIVQSSKAEKEAALLNIFSLLAV